MAALNPNDVVHLPGGLCFHMLPLFCNSSVINLMSSQEHERLNWQWTDLLPLACVCPVLCSRGLVCFAHEDSTRLAREVGTLQVERNRFVHLLPPRRAEEQGLGLSESWVWGLTCQLHDFSQAHVLWASASFLMNLQICSIPKYPYFGDRTKWQASEPLTG